MSNEKRVSSEVQLARFNALKNSKPMQTNGSINLAKISKDHSKTAENAKATFKRKPYYWCAKKKEEVVED